MSFNTELADFVAEIEKKRNYGYYDTVGGGIPTIGIGFKISEHKGTIAQYSSFDKQAYDNTEKKYKQGELTESEWINYIESLYITNDEMQNIFDAIIKSYITNTKNKVGETLFNSLTQNQQIVLVDMVYNGGTDLIGTNLKTALKNGDRVRAYYEIAYRSNGGDSKGLGLAARRKHEADRFSLFNGNSPTEAEAKQFFKLMNSSDPYSSGKTTFEAIKSYELTYASAFGLGNKPVTYSGKSMQFIAQKPFDMLVNKYANGVKIYSNPSNYEFNIFFGTAEHDTLKGTTKNDLIFGEAGNDTLNGNGGTDVIYGGTGNDTIDGGALHDKLYGEAGNDTISGGTGNDYLDGGDGDDSLRGGSDYDTLMGGSGNDQLFGDSGDDVLVAGDGADVLVGGSGSDTLLGQAGNDVLVGGNSLDDLYSEKEFDYLSGGTGFDTYLVSHTDVINDVDLNGLIMFNDKSLSGTKTKVDEYTYEDDNFTYTLSGSNMIVVDKILGEYITIENFNFNSGGMGMDFSEETTKKDVEIYVGDATVTEGGTLEFTVGIDNTLDKDLVLNVESYFTGSAGADDLSSPISGTITIKAGDPSGTFSIDTYNDTDPEPTENFTFAVTGYEYSGDDTNSILIKNAGEGTIEDNDKETLKIEVSNESMQEQNGLMTFSVSLIGTLEQGETLTVNLASYDGTASHIENDYSKTTGSVTFTSSNSTQTFSVPIKEDDKKESDEIFYLAPISTSGYTGIREVVLVNAGEGTIEDDDANGDISIDVSSVSADEGDSGT